MNNNPFADLIGTGSAQGQSQQGGGYEQLFAEYHKKPVPKKKKDFWVDQISTGGGIGGALAGAAGGAALGSVVPVLGTVIGGLAGGIAGGALGAGGGEVAENFITGEKDKFKNVGKEALLGGIFSAPPVRLARGAGAAGKAILGGSKAAEGVAEGAAKTGAKEAFEKGFTSPGVLATAGKTLRGEARGVGIGDKVSGNKLLPSQEQELNKFLEGTVKVKGLTAAKQLSSLEKFIANRNTELSKAISSSDRALTSAEKTGLTKTLTKQFGSDVIGQSPRQQAILGDITTRIKQSKNVSDLDALRKIIDGNINFARNAASPEPAAEQIFKMARSHLTDAVADRVGAAKTLKSDLSNAFRAQELLLNKAGGGGGYARAGTGGIATIPVPRRATQAAESVIGKGLGMTGKEGGGYSPASVVARNVIGGQLTGDRQSEPQDPSLDQALMQQGQFGGQQDSSQPQAQPQQTSPYSLENLQYDMQRDPKNADKYLAYYQQVQEVFGSSSAQPEYSSTVAGNLSDFQSSLDELGNLRESISSGAGTTDPLMGRLRSLNPYDTEQQTLQAAIDKTRQIVGKALEGGVLRKEDEEKYKKILPTTGDTKDVALQKIDMIQRQIASKLQNYRYLVGSGGGNSLQDALLQQSQGSYQ